MSWVAIGVGGASLIAGGIKSISGSKKAERAEEEIENLKTPTYTPNKSITDYYNAALKRYNTDPYQSNQYQYGIQHGQRGTAAGIGALQDRRSAVGGISRLIALQNENALKQGIVAENQQMQNLGQLGSAAQVKAQDDRFGFEVNQIMPFQKKLQLSGMKAGAGRQLEAAGWQDIGSGINTIGMGVYNGVQNGWGGGNNINSSNTMFDLNSLNGGGISGNWGTLQSGNPFLRNRQSSIFNYYEPPETYGE